MKTYCISDIHGHIQNFKRFVASLNEEDKVYVLGDVLDKGEEPIETLLLIMKDKRFTMLLGNHEYMMYQYFHAPKDSASKIVAYEQWALWNDGLRTLNQFQKLPLDQQVDILSFIENLPLCIPNLLVNTKSYYLVHSLKSGNTMLKLKEVAQDNHIVESYVWNRISPFEYRGVDEQIVIAGHTPVQQYLGLYAKEVMPVYDGLTRQESIRSAHYIDIDGGLASDLDNCRLIALCLNDLSFTTY